MAIGICDRFDFTPAETRFIANLVRAHGDPYALFKRITGMPPVQRREGIRCFEEKHTSYLLPLLLLALGDLVTSQLCTIRPDKYEAVLGFYQRLFQGIWARTKQGNDKPSPKSV
jgi:hypothetical protein